MARSCRLLSLAGFLALCLLAPTVSAQEPSTPPQDPGRQSASFGAGLSAKFPNNQFAVENQTGYGISAIMDFPFIPLLDFTAAVGWNRFARDNGGDALDIWEFLGGMRFRMGVFFMSGEVGYYTGIKETSFLPGLGLRFNRWEVALNVRAVSGGSWTGLRAGFYF